MKKTKKFWLYLTLISGAGIFVLFVNSVDVASILLNKQAFGHGGGTIMNNGWQNRKTEVNAINAPMDMTYNQKGVVKQYFDEWNRASLQVDYDTVSELTTFSVIRLQERLYDIRAENKGGSPVALRKPVTVRILAIMPGNFSEYGVYHYADGNWVWVPNATFFRNTSEVIFNIYETGLYQIMTPQVADLADAGRFPDGTLLRGPDMKIYAISNGRKWHIRTLWELAGHYRGQPINNVPVEVLNQY